MCLIAYKPKGEKFSWKALRRAYNANLDGCGYMFRYKGKVYHDKGLYTWRQLKAKLRPIAHLEVGVHFRWCTHGAINNDMCHPFTGPDWCMMHNGIVPGYGNGELSDTAEFAEYLGFFWGAGAPFKTDEWEYEIGGSKMLFALPGAEPWVIVGQEKGIWDRGVWYSNTGYQPAPKRTIGFDPIRWKLWEKSDQECLWDLDKGA